LYWSGLNGLSLGEFKLSVQRVPAQMAAMLLVPPSPSSTTGAATTSAASNAHSNGHTSAVDPLLASPPTSVLRLANMTTDEDLEDDEAFDEMQEDVGDECNNYGTVRSIVIPRPMPGEAAVERETRGVGLIFVSFTSPEGASRARNAVNGRTFNGRKVVAVFYPEKLFENKVRIENNINFYFICVFQIFKLPDNFLLHGDDENVVNDDDLN
jgi:RNA recognition motif-containing protein